MCSTEENPVVHSEIFFESLSGRAGDLEDFAISERIILKRNLEMIVHVDMGLLQHCSIVLNATKRLVS
jgi:hypothetical protein